MPELKHNFLKGRMNKDLDERLVPNGEYRDALNIEVSTSEGSDVGTVQTTMGNIKLSSIPVMSSTKCIGKILDEKNDKLYWLISESGTRPSPFSPLVPPSAYGDYYIADIIAEYDDTTGDINPIVVDTFYTAVTLTDYDENQGDGDWISVSSSSWSGDMDYVIYPGMEIDLVDQYGNDVFPEGTVVVDISPGGWQVRLSNEPLDPPTLSAVQAADYSGFKLKFESFNRPLNFQNDGVITGINIVDDFLLWTDNNSEPKKINIRRSKRERIINPYILPSPDFKTHSMLTITDTTSLTPNALKIARGNLPWSSTAPVPLKEEHVTIIKKSPLTTLSLEMSNTPRTGVIEGTLDYSSPTGRIAPNPGNPPFPNQALNKLATSANPHNPFWDYSPPGQMLDTAWVEFGGPNSRINQVALSGTCGGTTPCGNSSNWAPGIPLYNEGDTLIIETVNAPWAEPIRAKVTQKDNTHGSYNLDILSFDPTMSETERAFDVTLEQPDPLFEYKFPRFSFRYKYEDGEYSAFAPFSEIAFLPEKFEYLPKKGYNLGMTNNLRKLVIKDFVDDKLLPSDVLSIDILYKESGSPNIYTVKTITRDDFEWDAISESTSIPTGKRGYVNIESEMIHAILPSNQLLRPWDNVPKKALAQEVTANRLVYGNYLQNYNMRADDGEPININLQLTVSSKTVGEDGGESFHYTPAQKLPEDVYKYDPAKSVKTLRTYQLGVVYRDKYGRETPVFSTSTKKDGSDTSKASLFLEKIIADQQNKLKAQIKNNPPAWAESFKFFIKETSNEYYNLAMDRWYDAEDENIWLSFPSSERNKVDIDTFLILKKEKDNSNFVHEPARYKILAIESEAPTFIKTTEQLYGRVYDSPNKDVFASGVNTGFPIEDRTFVYVLEQAVKDAGWTSSLIEAGQPNLYMRMRTANATSNWYKIAGFSLLAPYYRVDIYKDIFGPDMNITTTDPNNVGFNTIIGGLSMEIKQNIIEHRAEFDGRFFVKIYKDQLLHDRIIKPSLDAESYTISDARNFGYINQGTSYNNDGTFSTGGDAGVTAHGVADWADTNNWVQGSNVGGGWNNGSYAPNVNNEDAPSHNNFWGPRRGWFIDQSDAYGAHGELRNGGPNGISYLVQYGENIADNIGGQGIEGSGKYIRIAYTKFGDRVHEAYGYGLSSSGAVNLHNLWEPGSDTVAQTKFIEQLCAPGTLWRWAEDPDQHVYVTLPGSNTGVPTAHAPFSVFGTTAPATNYMGAAPFGRHAYNFRGCCPANVTHHYIAWASRNMFRLRAERLFDGEPMGAPGGMFNAQYTPVNDPKVEGWFDSNNISLAKKGTCSDTAFNNDPQECLDAQGTFTFSTDAFYNNGVTSSGVAALSNAAPTLNQSANHPNTFAPGLRQDGDGMGGPTDGSGFFKENGLVGGAEIQPGQVTWEIIEPITRGQDLEDASSNPAIWETEPKEDIGLDIYHEVGQIYPIEINDKTNEEFAPIGSVVGCWRPGVGTVVLGGSSTSVWVPPIKVKSWDDNVVILEDAAGAEFENSTNPLYAGEHAIPNDVMTFTRPDGSKVSATLYWSSSLSPEYILFRNIHNSVKTLPWFNCYSFGNGVESDRVRDDYNQVTIDNGPKASTTLDEPYLEERRGSGLIYSGIYNSTSGINNLNQFVQAEKITKDLNPTYGSIQKLHTRDTNLITLCEDKILKVLANKDALFNADGSANLTATSNVLGQTTPFVGEYGISKNPESFASESFRAYFTDKSRGAVLRLSQDGLTPISEVGMKDWFSDNLKEANSLIGSYDDRKSTYNLTLNIDDKENQLTISFAEKVKGWSSFKSFIPESGESLNNNYYTFYQGNIWRHHDDTVDRNSFYNLQGEHSHDSTVTVLLNEDPGSVKSYGTLNYEGSQARITENVEDNEYYNNQVIPNSAGLGLPDEFGDRGNLTEFGWYVSNIKTNLQEIEELEFKDKEDKWFSQIKGVTTELSNVDTREFSVQGIDNASAIVWPTILGCIDDQTQNGSGWGVGGYFGTGVGALNYNPAATVDDGSCTYCIFGCMTGSLTYPQININYDPFATCDDGSCVDCDYGCMDSNSSNYDSAATCDDGSCLYCFYGCTNPIAGNYNPSATCDDGSCNEPCVYGCTDNGDKDQFWWDANYATIYPGMPTYPGSMFPIPGVFNPNNGACNWDPTATCDDGSCVYIVGCTDPTASNYDPAACLDSGICIGEIPGCTDPYALNYNPNATIDDGTCSYYEYGCMDDGNMPSSYINNGAQPASNPFSNATNNGSGTPGYQACNYDSSATMDDGSCYYEVDPEIGCPRLGCMDKCASNYDAAVTVDDGSCIGTSNTLGASPECVDISSTPYTHDFDNSFISGTTSSGSTASKSVIGYCWYSMNANGPGSNLGGFSYNDDWYWYLGGGVGNSGCASSAFKPLDHKDDYLLSPCTILDGGVNYKVSWKMRHGGGLNQYEGRREHVEVHIYDDPGSQIAPETIPTLTTGVTYLGTHIFPNCCNNFPNYFEHGITFTVPSSGSYHIGFHLKTDAGESFRLDLDNYKIEKQ